MSYRIGPNIELEQGAFGGQPSRSFEDTNFSEQGKHRLHNSSIGFCFIIFTLYS
jgi:hypothetical protein